MPVLCMSASSHKTTPTQRREVESSHMVCRIGRIGMFLLVWVLLITGCTVSEIPANVRRYQATQAARYPWTVEAIDEESKAHLCAALQLGTSSHFCQPGVWVTVEDLLPVLLKRFPESKTAYKEVATALQGFPVVVEESKSPDPTRCGPALKKKG